MWFYEKEALRMGEMTSEEFCSWLCAKEQAVFEHPTLCFYSPLALWLLERTGRVYGVDGQRYGCAGWDDCQWLLLPRWAQMFIARLEAVRACVVTGAEAFALLAGVERALTPWGGYEGTFFLHGKPYERR